MMVASGNAMPISLSALAWLSSVEIAPICVSCRQTQWPSLRFFMIWQARLCGTFSVSFSLRVISLASCVFFIVPVFYTVPIVGVKDISSRLAQGIRKERAGCRLNSNGCKTQPMPTLPEPQNPDTKKTPAGRVSSGRVTHASSCRGLLRRSR